MRSPIFTLVSGPMVMNAEGARVGFPHGQSANVMFYNYTWAQELGFDAPPATLDELEEQVCAAAAANTASGDPDLAGTGGIVVYPGASDVAVYLFAVGGDFYDDSGTAYDYDQPRTHHGGRILEGNSMMKDAVSLQRAIQTQNSPHGKRSSR